MSNKRIIHIDVPTWADPVRRCYNTQGIKHNGVLYCQYCGKPLEHFEDWDRYESTDYYNCNCEDAMKEFEYNLAINYLKNNMPKPKYKLKTTVELTKIKNDE